jgi:cell division protein FtsQ
MTMLERRSRSASKKAASREAAAESAESVGGSAPSGDAPLGDVAGAGAQGPGGRRRFGRKHRRDETVPPSAGADEETVRIAHADFRKRRHAGLWRTLRRVLLALLLVGLLAGSAWLVLFSSYVTARSVEVDGTVSVGESRIERIAEVPTGTPLARVDLDAIGARVEAIAAVRRVEVSRSWPHTVRIAVTERTPIAVVDRGSGLQAMDAEGVLFGSYDTVPKALPLVRTESGTRTEALVETGRVVDALPEGIARRVDVVEVATVDEIELVLGSGRRVLWGSAEDSDQKAEVLAVLLARPGQQIDVSVPGRPTTR